MSDRRCKKISAEDRISRLLIYGVDIERFRGNHYNSSKVINPPYRGFLI